jgi:hypothetical protein
MWKKGRVSKFKLQQYTKELGNKNKNKSKAKEKKNKRKL